MIEIPVWIIITSITAIFGIGAGVTKFLTGHVTPKQLEERLQNCQKSTKERYDALEMRVTAMHEERSDIWDCVRKTEQRTAVIEEGQGWMRQILVEIKESIGRNGNGKI